MSGDPKSTSESQIANTIVDWAAILYLPSFLVFTVIAIGGLTDWTPLFPDGWGMAAVLGFHFGYGMAVFLLVRWQGRKETRIQIPTVNAPALTPNSASDSNRPPRP